MLISALNLSGYFIKLLFKVSVGFIISTFKLLKNYKKKIYQTSEQHFSYKHIQSKPDNISTETRRKIRNVQ